jgi:hypothetical protein
MRYVECELLHLQLFFCLGFRVFFGHLFTRMEKVLWNFSKGEKLNQTLLKFVPLCSLGIYILIVSLKHHLNNPSFFDYILKLKALFGYDYI